MRTAAKITPVGRSGHFARSKVWGALLGAVALVAGAGLVGARMASVPADLDTSAEQVTERGLYRVSYEPQGGSIPVGRLHTWTLRVTTPGGEPVGNASIRVDGDMPQHGHGLPTAPKVSRGSAPGEYRVDGVRFQMNGWWVMDFTVQAGAGEDTAHFNLRLP